MSAVARAYRIGLSTSNYMFCLLIARDLRPHADPNAPVFFTVQGGIANGKNGANLVIDRLAGFRRRHWLAV
jgi:hypothetical protein